MNNARNSSAAPKVAAFAIVLTFLLAAFILPGSHDDMVHGVTAVGDFGADLISRARSIFGPA